MKKQNRSTNMDIARILAMLFIISNHLVVNGLDWTSVSTRDVSSNVLFYCVGGVLEAFLIIGVNVFFLLSGYFRIQFRWKNLLSIVLTVYIYMFLIQIIGIWVGFNKVDKTLLVFFLQSLDQYWFLLVYIFLMLLAPLLNIIVENISREQASQFVFVFLVFFCAVAFVDNNEKLGINRGFSLVSACCLYLVGALYKKGYVFSSLFRTKNKSLCVWLLSCGANALLIVFSITVLKWGKLGSILLMYNNPIVVISSVSFVAMFSQLKCEVTGMMKGFLTMFGSNTIAVYILHSSNRVIPHYRNLLIELLYAKLGIMVYFTVFLYAALIYVVCVAINIVFVFAFGQLIDTISIKIEKIILSIHNKCC